MTKIKSQTTQPQVLDTDLRFTKEQYAAALDAFKAEMLENLRTNVDVYVANGTEMKLALGLNQEIILTIPMPEPPVPVEEVPVKPAKPTKPDAK